jgi:hypothetical protein
MKRRQQGITFLGWLFLIVPIGIVVYCGIRIGPPYMDDAKLATVLKKTGEEFSGTGNSRREAIQNSLSRRLQIEYLDQPSVDDIDIRRAGDGWRLEVAYSRKVALFGNLSALIEFDHSVEIN